MPIEVKCDRCGAGLESQGGLAFGPPRKTLSGKNSVQKLHVCRDCWKALYKWVRSGVGKAKAPAPPPAASYESILSESPWEQP